MTARHFLDLWSVPAAELRSIVDEAKSRKQARSGWPAARTDADAPLAGHVLAMVFEAPSTRTRVSFDLAMRQLGGGSMVLNAGDIQLGRGESPRDTARVLSRLVDATMLRVRRHETLLEWSDASSIPVVNGLTDRSHPCQILAALMTLEERGLDLRGARLAWVGDGNNVCASFAHAAGKFGYSLAIATPPDHALPEIDRTERGGGGRIVCHATAEEAVAGADAVITDTFVSMGDAQREERLKVLAPFRVDARLMRQAAPGALFSHCLPAYRGVEVTAEVIDGPRSVVFDEAENRLHTQKAILLWCLGGGAD